MVFFDIASQQTYRCIHVQGKGAGKDYEEANKRRGNQEVSRIELN